MLEFKTIQTLKPNAKILEVIKDYKYKIKNGKVKNLLHTNLQVIKPTEYLIKYPISITILEYKSKEINQLEVVKLINNYKNIAEEIILNEFNHI